MFTGMTLASGFSCFSNSATQDEPLNILTMRDMIADELYATKNLLVHFNWKIPQDWDYETYLHGQYQNSVMAGNVSYSDSIVKHVKVKKRYVGDFTWKTIYEKDIENSDDFLIEFYDYYEPSNRDVEYIYVPVIDGADTDITSSAVVHSEFQNYFLCEKNQSYPMIVNAVNTPKYNRASSVIVSPGSKYPYVVNNGIAKYYSGTMEVMFIEMDEHCELDTVNGWSYRNRLDKYLTDGKPKILKSFEGDMWMVNIVGDLPRTVSDGYQFVTHQIEWVECGNPNMIGDLYDNGFIDTDTDREGGR